MGRVIAAFAQFFDGDGLPLARGWLRFLESGSNNTNKNTFNDPVYQIPNANPLQLDAEGRCPNVFGTGDYRVISFINDPDEQDSPGEQIQMFDPVTAESTAAAGGGTGSFNLWDSLETYGLGDIVTYNTYYYRSLITGNLNNNPAIETSAWERVDFIHYWNDTYTYSQGALVYMGYNLYLSKQSLNINNDPENSPDYWRPVATGYHNIYIKTANYEILPTEFDSIFILGSATAANRQFDLPVMDATTDRFKVAIYNQSSFDLTVSALGTSSVWIDSTGDLILETGTFQEFIYSYDIDTWMPVNNSAQALGGQQIGTVSMPIVDIRATQVHAVQVFISDYLYVPTIFQNDDQYHYFGSGQDANIHYDGSIFWLQNTNGLIRIQSTTEIQFHTVGAYRWQISDAGNLRPALTNTYDIGSTTLRLHNIYQGDSCVHYWGDSQDFYTYFNGTDTYIYGAAANIVFGLSGAGNIRFRMSGADALLITSSSSLILYGSTFSMNGATQTLNFGSPLNAKILHDDSNFYIDYTVGNLYFRRSASPATTMMLDTSGNVNFYGNTSIGSDEVHYLGDANQAYIGFSAATGFNIRTTAAYPLLLGTNNSTRWFIASDGHLYPNVNTTYNIGSTSLRVQNAFLKNIYPDLIRAPNRLDIDVNNGVSETLVWPGSLSATFINKMQLFRIYENGSLCQIYFLINGTYYGIQGSAV